jgi:hypothetical protein
MVDGYIRAAMVRDYYLFRKSPNLTPAIYFPDENKLRETVEKYRKVIHMASLKSFADLKER